MKHLPILFLLIFLDCNGPGGVPNDRFPTPEPPQVALDQNWPEGLDRSLYYDKVLGLLVGSAIGDAMGAPVEMWSRQYIQVQYGFIDTVVAVRRPGQAEGPWEDNLAPGATTDDTRWKYLLGRYLLTQYDTTLDDRAFAQFILDLYQQELEDIKSVETFDPEPLERELLQVQWLQEWAKVAKPFVGDDLTGYSYAVNRFYGGEMACAGMLYSPLVGAVYPNQTDKAYLESYKLGLFDLGYARDVSALTAAYVAKAMEPGVSIEQIADITQSTDPLRYFNSRLVERIAYRSYTSSKEIAFEAKGIDSASVDPHMALPKGYRGSRLEYARLQKAYELLELNLHDTPFHAGEIHLINLTALAFSEGDFMKAMTFVVNFGRDNDTVAAVTGAILGAYVGYAGLPQGMSQVVMRTSKDVMGIDLELLATQLSEQRFVGN